MHDRSRLAIWNRLSGLLLGVAAITGCGKGDVADQPGDGAHASPESVSAAFEKAVKRHDFKSAFQMMTEKSQRMFSEGALRICDLQSYDGGEKLAALREIMKAHGVTRVDEKMDVFKVKDKGEFYAKLHRWWSKYAAREDFEQFPDVAKLFSDMEFSDFKTENDTATAKVSLKGESQRYRIDFMKVNGKWLLALAEAHSLGVKNRNR